MIEMKTNNDLTSVIPTFINTDRTVTKIVQKFDKPIFYKVEDVNAT